jgi:SAM-dependent methyltransferase
MKSKTENKLDIAIENTWYKHWFDSSFYHQLYANRNEKEAADFIDNLINELDLPANAPVLDLGCGAGRHAKQLCEKGFSVTGLDLSAASIWRARKMENDRLRFLKHDMRVPFGFNCFDAVFNFFTSFGYFTDNSENSTVIRNVSNSLKPGGIFVMDYLNPVVASKKLVPFEMKEIDGVFYKIERTEDEDFFYKKITIGAEGMSEPMVHVEQVRKFSLFDLDCLFRVNGLKLKEVFGDYGLGEFRREDSGRMILVGEK